MASIIAGRNIVHRNRPNKDRIFVTLISDTVVDLACSIYSFGSTIPFCDWYFPLRSL